jgi:hypothetical protein
MSVPTWHHEDDSAVRQMTSDGLCVFFKVRFRLWLCGFKPTETSGRDCLSVVFQDVLDTINKLLTAFSIGFHRGLMQATLGSIIENYKLHICRRLTSRRTDMIVQVYDRTCIFVHVV